MTTLFHGVSSHARAAREWAAAHPAMVAELEAIVLDWAGAGQRFSIYAACNVLRWSRRYRKDEQPYLINNSHLPTVADMLIERHPWLNKFIERRARGYSAPHRSIA